MSDSKNVFEISTSHMLPKYYDYLVIYDFFIDFCQLCKVTQHHVTLHQSQFVKKNSLIS